ELAKLEAVAGGYRADFERERDRARPAHGGALRATADPMAARGTAARAGRGVTGQRGSRGEVGPAARAATRTGWGGPPRRARGGGALPCPASTLVSPPPVTKTR